MFLYFLTFPSLLELNLAKTLFLKIYIVVLNTFIMKQLAANKRYYFTTLYNRMIITYELKFLCRAWIN